MSIQSRLQKLEEAARLMRPSDVLTVEGMSDVELWAIIRAGRADLPADVDQVTDEMLLAIAGGA